VVRQIHLANLLGVTESLTGHDLSLLSFRRPPSNGNSSESGRLFPQQTNFGVRPADVRASEKDGDGKLDAAELAEALKALRRR
jgi:hypothetical protein